MAGLEIPALVLMAPALLFPSPARLSVLAVSLVVALHQAAPRWREASMASTT